MGSLFSSSKSQAPVASNNSNAMPQQQQQQLPLPNYKYNSYEDFKGMSEDDINQVLPKQVNPNFNKNNPYSISSDYRPLVDELVRAAKKVKIERNFDYSIMEGGRRRKQRKATGKRKRNGKGRKMTRRRK
jgi:hypothetical protein